MSCILPCGFTPSSGEPLIQHTHTKLLTYHRRNRADRPYNPLNNTSPVKGDLVVGLTVQLELTEPVEITNGLIVYLYLLNRNSFTFFLT